MEKRVGRRRKDESFEATADSVPITTSRITTRRSSVNSEGPNSGRNSRASITTEKPATRTSARKRSQLAGSTTVSVPPTVPEELSKEIKPEQEKTKSPVVSKVESKLSKVSPTVKVVPVLPVITEEVRNSASRQIDVSKGTVDLTEADNDAPVPTETIEHLTDYIRRSASVTISNVTQAFKRSMSRPRSISQSETATESRYSHSNFEEEDEFSDQEDNAQYVSTNSEHFLSSMEKEFLCRPKEIPREFGGPWFICLLLIGLPVLVTYIVGSTFTSDGLNIIQQFMPKGKKQTIALLQHIFPNDVVAAFLCFHINVFILSGTLVGLIVNLPRVNHFLKLKFNALPMAILLNLIWIVSAIYTKFSVVDYVLANQWRFFLYGLLYAYVTAMWSYLRAAYCSPDLTIINIYGKTNNILVDFALGRFLNPKWLDWVDLKQYCYRAHLMLTLLIAECYFIKCLPTSITQNWSEILVGTNWQNINWTSGSLLAASMLIIYVSDSIIFEHHLASSFELQSEGFGALLLLRYAATPFLLTGILRNAHVNDAHTLEKIHASLAIVGLFLGIICKRMSSAVKYKYRINPRHIYFNNVDTIHTFQGRRLLVDRFWGAVRQPNYAGDILALIALFTPFLYTTVWQAHAAIILIIIMLLHRATRANKRNYQRYHSAWMRYCKMVPYYIIPNFF